MFKGRVMIVDDEQMIRQSVQLILRKAGYTVVEASNGEEAIKAVRSGDNPLMLDAIVFDLNIPKMHGKEAIALIREQFPSVQVLVLTGHTEVSSATDLFKKGIVDYLLKPIDPKKLTVAVKKAVDNRKLFNDQFAV